MIRVLSFHSTTKRLGVNSLWLLLARLVVQLQLVVFTVLIARALGVAGFGEYAFVAAMIALGNVATTFGTDMLLIREIARTHNARASIIPAALWIQLGLAIVWIVATLVGAEALSNQSREVAAALKLYSLSLLPLAFFTVYTALLRAYERMDLYLLLNVLLAVTQLIAAWLILQYSQKLIPLVLTLNVVQLLAALSAGVVCRIGLTDFHLHWRVTRAQMMPVLRLAWPFALLSVLAVIYQRLGVVMLSASGGDVQVGWYAAAARLIEPVKLLHIAVLGALLPALSHLHVEETAQRWFKRSFWFLLAVGSLAALIMNVIAPLAIPLLFGASYAGSIPVVRVLALSLIPYSVSASLSLRFVTQDRERHALGVMAMSVAIACALNAWLIPQYGMVGAALAVVGSEGAQAMIFLAMLRSEHLCQQRRCSPAGGYALLP